MYGNCKNCGKGFRERESSYSHGILPATIVCNACSTPVIECCTECGRGLEGNNNYCAACRRYQYFLDQIKVFINEIKK